MFGFYRTLGVDLPSLHTMLLSKLPSVALQNALSTVTAFRTIHCFSSRNSLHGKRSGAIGPCSWNSWNSYHVSHHPEVAGLVEKWNGLLKTHSQCQLAGNIFPGWGKVVPKAVYSLTQCSLYGAVSPTARIHGSRNQGSGHSYSQ